MIEFNNLKNSYIFVIQLGILTKQSSYLLKQGNEILHKYYGKIIDNSNYSEIEKWAMKQQLEILKEALSQEIESYERRLRK